MATFSSIVRSTQLSLNAVTSSFSPPAEANSSTLRKNGFICLLIGVACFGLSGIAIAAFRANLNLALLPSLLGYAFIAVGGYRVIRGKESKAQYSAEVSWTRVLLGMFSVIFCFSVFIGLVIILEWL